MPHYYARVGTAHGDVIHLAKIWAAGPLSAKSKEFSPDALNALKTLCGHGVTIDYDCTGDPADCMSCLKKEKAEPLPRATEVEGVESVDYVPRHRRRKQKR